MPSYFQPVNAYALYPNQLQYTQPNYSPIQTAPASTQNSQGIIWVQGESGAKSFLVGAGQSVLLMDSESSTFYIKSSDASGMPLPLRVFDYSERTSNQVPPAQESALDPKLYVTHEEFERFKNEIFKRKQQGNQNPSKEGA